MLVTGGDERRLADPAQVVRLLRHRYASVVVDLSHLDAAEQAGYVAGLPGEIEAQRAVTGLPQWVVVDEAHEPFGRTGTALGVFNPAAKGYLLVTWQPEELSGEVPAALDAVIALGSLTPLRPPRRPHRRGGRHAPRPDRSAPAHGQPAAPSLPGELIPARP